jgi:hypothetical protein
MEFDDIAAFPTFREGEIHDSELTLEEFKSGKNRFIMYEIDGEYRIRFDNLSAACYACIAAKLSYREFEKLWEFLKLCLEGVRHLKKQNKKGLEMAVRIEKHIRQYEVEFTYE